MTADDTARDNRIGPIGIIDLDTYAATELRSIALFGTVSAGGYVYRKGAAPASAHAALLDAGLIERAGESEALRYYYRVTDAGRAVWDGN